MIRRGESQSEDQLFGGFLEEIVEGCASVVRGAGRRSRCLGTLLSSGSKIAGDRHAWFEQFALVRLVFEWDPRWDRFQALEPRGRFEACALFAAVQRRAALGTVAFPVDVAGKLRRAAETSCRRYVL